MRYYISDLHFFHTNINSRLDKRGFPSVEEMNEFMISQWNSKVRSNDEVVILGDLSLGTAEQTNSILDRLKGKLFLIEGNHDKFLKSRKSNLSRFEWIKGYAEMNDNGRKVVLCHYPIMCYNGQFRKDSNGNPTTWMLYGHVHNTQDLCGILNYIQFVKQFPRIQRGGNDYINEPIPIQMINCFCMYSNYIPLSLDEWIELDKNNTNKIDGDWKY